MSQIVPAANQLYTDQQVADRFGVSRRTVHRWARKGILPKLRVGGSTRFRATDLDALISVVDVHENERSAGQPGAPTPGPALGSELDSPGGVAVDSAGNLYIADTFNDDVEEVFGVATPVPPPVDVTATAVSCAPTALALGAVSTCTATVKDTAASGASTPTGTVGFTAAPATAAFGTAGSCPLAPSATAHTATCQATLTPSAAGTYTVTAAYDGDLTHHASSAASGAVSVDAGGPLPTSHGVASIGHPHVKGSTVTVTVSCTGTAACPVTVQLFVRETIRHGKVIAVTAKAKQHGKTQHRTVVLGTATVTVAVNHTSTVVLHLNAKGRRLLSAHHRLKAKLTTTQSGTTLASATINFKAKQTKQTKRRR